MNKSISDKEFLAFVKQHRDFGYGRMMSIISYAWYECLKREYPGFEDGAFVGMCISDLSPVMKDAYLEVLQRYKDDGMDF